MRNFKLLLVFVAVFATLQASALSRDCNLTVKVVTATGESLEGQRVMLVQTDYSMTYGASETTLDAAGECRLKVYSGNHRLTVERAGYAAYAKDFPVTGDMTLNVTLTEDVRNPFALKLAERHDPMTGKNDVTLQWNREDPVFFDDFESYTAFDTEFSPWTGIDGDHAAAAPLQGSYPNRGTLQYAQVINPLVVEPSWWTDYPVLRPYGGKQYVGFVRTYGGSANDDWLISPAVTVGKNNIVRFMAKAADVYKERFEVGITTVDNPEASDFTVISSGNYETVGYEEWEAKEYSLADYEGETVRIAIHYIGDPSNGGAFMLMVDDFFVGQADYFSDAVATKSLRCAMRSPYNPNERFLVYKNGEQVGETDGYSFAFDQLEAGSYTLGVKAVYKNAESELVEQPFEVGAGTFCKVIVAASANDNVEVDGVKVEFFNESASTTYSAVISKGAVEIPSLPAGNYIVSVEADRYDKWSKSMEIADGAKVDIALVETIFDPYNITVTQTDSETDADKVNAEVRWNQDLGFEDDFEAYDDFATSFGEWKSVDNDRRVVYPIALGSASNIINFPGACTPDNQVAVAPMVFNPYATTPAMAPSDVAAVAQSGEKAVIFFSPQQAAADKWLISPAQTVMDGYVCRISLKAYSEAYPETFELCVSTTDDSVISFKSLGNIMPKGTWQTYEVDLSAYAGQTVYLALHYISNDCFFSLADDFYVGPKEATDANVGNVQKYDLYLDGAYLGSTSATFFPVMGISRGEHTLGIQASYVSGKSKLVEFTFNAQGAVADVAADSVEITAFKGGVRIFGADGSKVIVSDASGRQVASASLADGAEIALPAGFYIVSVGSHVEKVLVR